MSAPPEEKVCPKCQERAVDKFPPCPLQCQSPLCKSYGPRANLDFRQIPIIWILGGPGSGKGTQCEKIIKEFGFTHLSTGDLLRAEVDKGTKLGKEISGLIAQGVLVPNNIVLNLLKDAMVDKKATSNGFLIDGYPREQAQGIAFEKNIAPCTVILYFDAALEVLVQRLNKRAVTSGRSDDNEDSIRARLQTFMDNNNAVLMQYPKKMHRINANRSVDEIYADVQRILKPYADGTFCSKG